MSAPGNKDDGYVLIDVLTALIIVSIGFGSVFGALTTAVNNSVRFENKVFEGLNGRNESVDEFGK